MNCKQELTASGFILNKGPSGMSDPTVRTPSVGPACSLAAEDKQEMEQLIRDDLCDGASSDSFVLCSEGEDNNDVQSVDSDALGTSVDSEWMTQSLYAQVGLRNVSIIPRDVSHTFLLLGRFPQHSGLRPRPAPPRHHLLPVLQPEHRPRRLHRPLPRPTSRSRR